jgi:hypothetical protein
VLGRTGAGKTALLRQIKHLHRQTCAELSPEALALNFVTNSSVIQFFEEAGVQLDIFYTLLWRHIITVELLKLKYEIQNEIRQQSFLGSILGKFTLDKGKARAIEYLQEWGDKFWQETEYRTKEFTRKLERDLSASAKIDASRIALGATAARKLTEDEKVEVRESGTRVVNEVQVRDLHNVINFLSEDIFISENVTYYIVIDRLDEDWVDDRIRFKLIKALIEAVRTFHKVRCVKIIVALRADLHYRILQETPGAGFQEEKYRSLYLNVKWTRDQLIKLVDERVGYLFRWKYTKANVKLSDILPDSQIDHRSLIDYMLDRTFFRPREAILYLNECLQLSEGRTKITPQIVRKAEGAYSQQRLSSLFDEWRRDFPNLELAAQMLRGRASNFALSDIDSDSCDKCATHLLENNRGRVDLLSKLCENFYLADGCNVFEFTRDLMLIFYRVGLVGVKLAPYSERLWSFDGPVALDPLQVRNDTVVSVHKTFWAALGSQRVEKN